MWLSHFIKKYNTNTHISDRKWQVLLNVSVGEAQERKNKNYLTTLILLQIANMERIMNY